MVLAGAGSGKTRVLTTRASWLMGSQGVRADQILLVTFTNKASIEMVNRLEHQVGSHLPYAGTFHRLCARFLRAHGNKIGIGHDFSIYDEDDQASLMTTIVKELGYATKDAKPRGILAQISSAKNELMSPQQYAQIAKGAYQELIARAYKIYQQRLAKSGAVDFDDLLMSTVKLFSEAPMVLREYQEQFLHVLIDEYQDTNTAQYALTKMLAFPQQNLFVVGDFSQAIYGWRGADYRNMMTLENDFPDIVTYKLERNYRSTQTILDAASGVIANNKSHPVLSLWTEKKSGKPVTVYEAGRDTQEVAFVISQIWSLQSIYLLSDIVILYRTNAQSRVFEERLIAEGIPYRLVGGVRFYERREIKDILSYLRLFLNANDEVSRLRIQKIGKRKFSNFMQWLETYAKSDLVVTKALDVMDLILEKSEYLKQFDEHDEEDQSRIENIKELRSLAAQFDSVSLLLETIALVEQEAQKKEVETKEALTLMSVHAAKGLEFGVVFLVGLEEGLFPHSRSLMDRQQMEEERRLCYVALTRAKDMLFTTYARRRMSFGVVSSATVSRFILEMPPQSYIKLSSDVTNDFAPSPGQRIPKHEVRFVPFGGSQGKPFDDPSIDDFLEGSLNVDDFLNS